MISVVLATSILTLKALMIITVATVLGMSIIE